MRQAWLMMMVLLWQHLYLTYRTHVMYETGMINDTAIWGIIIYTFEVTNMILKPEEVET